MAISWFTLISPLPPDLKPFVYFFFVHPLVTYQAANYDRMTEELGREMTAVPPVGPRGRVKPKMTI